MSYVMVPVPAEIKDQVMAVIGQLAFADALANWDSEALREFLAEVSEEERALIDQLVEAAGLGRRLVRHQLADSLDVSDHELDATIIELNRRAGASGNPWLIMVTRGEEAEASPEVETIYIVATVAETIRSFG